MSPDLRFSDQAPVERFDWAFTTGFETGLEWRFGTPKIFSDNEFMLFKDALAVDGKLVAISRIASAMLISVSVDDGLTFTEAAPITALNRVEGATVEDLDLVYKNQTLYLAWTVYRTDIPAEALFSRSISADLLTYTKSIVLSDPFDQNLARETSIEVTLSGQIYAAWK